MSLSGGGGGGGGGGDLSLLQIASTKLYCYHSVIINVIEINRSQSLIVLQKYDSM